MRVGAGCTVASGLGAGAWAGGMGSSARGGGVGTGTLDCTGAGAGGDAFTDTIASTAQQPMKPTTSVRRAAKAKRMFELGIRAPLGVPRKSTRGV